VGFGAKAYSFAEEKQIEYCAKYSLDEQIIKSRETSQRNGGEKGKRQHAQYGGCCAPRDII